MRKLSVIVVVGLLWAGSGQICAQNNSWTTFSKDLSTFFGGAELVHVDLTISVNPWYLDCEHTFEISAITENQVPVNFKDSLCMTGDINLPTGAVIVGGQLWDGNVIIRSQLFAAKVASNSSGTGADTLGRMGQASMSITKLRSFSLGDEYQVKLFPIKTGWNRQFSIRYLIPQREIDGSVTMPFAPILDMHFTKIPSTMNISIQSNGQMDSASLQFEGIDDYCKLPALRQISLSPLYNEYGSRFPYTVSIPAKYRKKAVATQFPASSPYKGNYFLYWGSVPEQLSTMATPRVEVLFVWKWFGESGFVTRESDGQKYVNGGTWGSEISSQAFSLKSALVGVAYSGAKVGLIHDRESTQNDKQFPLSYRGTPEFENMVRYLQKNTNKSYIISTIQGSVQGGYEEVTEEQKNATAKKGTEEFTVCMQKAFSMFSPSENVVRHIVVVTAGASYDLGEQNMNFYRNPGFSGVTVDINGSWNGVPVMSVENQFGLGNGYCQGYSVPDIKACNYVLTFESSTMQKKTEIIPFNQVNNYLCPNSQGTIPACFFAGQSQGAWLPKVRWDLYQKNGQLMGSYLDTLTLPVTTNDSALAKMWAGSVEPISETQTLDGLSGIYGFVDQYSYMNTRFGDTISINSSNAVTSRTSYFANQEIMASKPQKLFGKSEIHISFKNGFIECSLSGLPVRSDLSINIVNARGQVIYRSTLGVKVLNTGGRAFTIALHAAAAGMYFCTVSNREISIKKTFTIL